MYNQLITKLEKGAVKSKAYGTEVAFDIEQHRLQIPGPMVTTLSGKTPKGREAIIHIFSSRNKYCDEDIYRVEATYDAKTFCSEHWRESTSAEKAIDDLARMLDFIDSQVSHAERIGGRL